MFIPATNKNHNWQDCTLILPTVSVGNVGQLATDLVVSTLWMERIGFIIHPSLLPMVGNNPFAHEDATSCKLTTCCEVYESLSAQVVVIQQRAPLIRGRKKEYIDWLSDWIKKMQFYQVVILTSSFSQERIDKQILSSPFRILKSEKMDESSGEFFKTKMQWKELEHRQTFPAPAGQGSQTSPEETSSIYMPGSGIAKNLFEKCQTLPVLVLMMFVSEGDNAPDALAMADQLNAWLNLIIKKEDGEKGGNRVESKDIAKGITQWKIPMSWRLLYGSHFDQKLFQ